MTPDWYHLALGRLIGNYHALEAGIRAVLYKYNEATEPQVDLPSIREGDHVVVNSMTNYDSLRVLITKFNRICELEQVAIELDLALVDVRDNLAHGRVMGLRPGPPFHVTKFGKQANDRVQVECHQVMDEVWFEQRVAKSSRALTMVMEASRRLNLDVFVLAS